MPSVPPDPVYTEGRIGMVCALLAMTSVFCLTLYLPALPEIVKAMDTTDFAVKMTVTVYFCTFAFSQLVCGPLSDAFGRRPVIIGFTAITTTGAVIAACSHSIELLLISRAVQGLGAGVGNSTTRAVIRDLFTGQAAARVLNLMILMVGVGPTFAPMIGGVVVASFGWRAVLILGASYTVVVLLIVMIFLPETNTNKALHALRTRKILHNYWHAFSHPSFVRPGFTAALTSGVMPLFPTMLPFILIDQFKLSVADFGLIMGLHAAVFVLGASATRFALRHMSSGELVPIGLGFYLASGIAMVIVLLTFPLSLWAVFIPVCTMTFCVPVMQPGLQSEAIAEFGPTAGVVASLIGFMQMFFAFIGTTTASLFANPSMGLTIVGFTMSAAAVTVYLRLRSEPVIP